MILPQPYPRWLAEALPGPLPEEPQATCDSCAMCAATGQPGEEHFGADTKCCTFFPDLPSFLVGQILSDDTLGEGRERVAARISRGAGLTPLALFSPPGYSVQYRLAESAFGRSTELLCPYFHEGKCSIWPYRYSICRTWFCKHARGAVGLRFWTALRDLLGAAEVAVSNQCLLELGLEPGAMRELLAWRKEVKKQLDGPALEGRIEQERLDRIWGRWRGRELLFYEECSELVAAMSWSEVRQAGGAALTLLEGICLDAYQRHSSSQIPERLGVGHFTLIGFPGDSAKIASYNAYDPLELPRELLDVLSHFDGRTTALVLDEILADEGLELGEDLIQLLFDFEILVASRG